LLIQELRKTDNHASRGSLSNPEFRPPVHPADADCAPRLFVASVIGNEDDRNAVNRVGNPLLYVVHELRLHVDADRAEVALALIAPLGSQADHPWKIVP